MARKSSKSTAMVVSGVLYTDDDWTGTQVNSLAWSFFLKEGRTFYCDLGDASYTARPEKRREGFFWYGYKKVRGKLLKRYIGRAQDVTINRLVEVGKSFIQV